MTRRRPDSWWAVWDAELIGAWVVVMLLGTVIRPMYYVGLGIVALVGVVALVRHLRRRRRWRTQPPGEFWADRVKE